MSTRKSLAEQQGMSFEERTEEAYKSLKEHLECLAAIESDALAEDAALAEKRRSEIPTHFSGEAQALMRQSVADDAEMTTAHVAELARVSLAGVESILDPIFGADAVAAALERIRKEPH
jgi:CRISPR/Cas system-associated endonuclease Cas3-HD